MDAAAPRFAMVAGEASGDLLAGLLLGGLRARWPGLVAHGIGGPKMAAQGFEAWWPHDKLAVRGYVEVLSHYRELVGIRNQLAERLLRRPSPTCSSASMRPTSTSTWKRGCKAAGIQTVHFVSPSIWAWRGKRIEKIRKAVDPVLCIFPFEPAIYAKHGIAGDLRRPSAGRCDPARGAACGEPQRARPRREATGGGAAAGQPPLRDPVHRAAPVRPRPAR